MTPQVTERAAHMAWAKARALEYLDAGDLGNALASMVSDLGKHPTTAEAAHVMAPFGLAFVMSGDGPGLRHWIEGFA